jgi:protein SCO1/2
MAQATEAAIPKASQLILPFMRQIYGLKSSYCNKVAKISGRRKKHCTFAIMSKKSIFYIVFFTGLAVAFYFVLRLIVPGYGQEKFQVLSVVKPFYFTNQDGKTVTRQDVEGKVYVAEYFFTTCPGICPILNTNMKDIYEAFKDNPNFLILSHTVDPETDSVARLKVYSDSMQVDSNKWYFLTGSKDSLYNAARVSYLLDDPKNNVGNIDEQFLHTQFFALVDKKGRVRKKIYDGLKKGELKELKEDIATLLKEPATDHGFTNNLFTN